MALQRYFGPIVLSLSALEDRPGSVVEDATPELGNCFIDVFSQSHYGYTMASLWSTIVYARLQMAGRVGSMEV